MNAAYDCIIIGSGLAGYTLAKSLRAQSFIGTIAIFSAHDGCFYSKPRLSTAFIQGKTADNLIMKTAREMSADLSADIFPNTPVLSINATEQSILVKGASVSYDALVLATGASPAPLPFEAYRVNHLSDYSVLRDVLESKRRVLVVGSGLVGCELAADLNAGGYDVALISRSAYPLSHYVTELEGRSLQAEVPIAWYFNTEITYVEKINQGVSVTLSNNQQLQADIVLAATGLLPNTQLAKDAGIAVKRGVVVNEFLETSAENIYALGDCAEVFGVCRQFIKPLRAQADCLANCLVGNKAPLLNTAFEGRLKIAACPLCFKC